VRTAESVASGLKQLETALPAFAVVDMRLADGSGLDVISALKSRRPDARAIVLTGYGNIATAVNVKRRPAAERRRLRPPWSARSGPPGGKKRGAKMRRSGHCRGHDRLRQIENVDGAIDRRGGAPPARIPVVRRVSDLAAGIEDRGTVPCGRQQGFFHRAWPLPAAYRTRSFGVLGLHPTNISIQVGTWRCTATSRTTRL
jgi:CheY-like chemotaxis protein